MAAGNKTVKHLGVSALLGPKAGIITAGIEAATPLVKALVETLSDPQKRAEIMANMPKMNAQTDNSAAGLTARAEGLAVQLEVLAETADQPGEAQRVAAFRSRLDGLRKAVPFAAMAGRGSKRELRRLGRKFDDLASDILAALVDEVAQAEVDAPSAELAQAGRGDETDAALVAKDRSNKTASSKSGRRKSLVTARLSAAKRNAFDGRRRRRSARTGRSADTDRHRDSQAADAEQTGRGSAQSGRVHSGTVRSGSGRAAQAASGADSMQQGSPKSWRESRRFGQEPL